MGIGILFSLIGRIGTADWGSVLFLSVIIGIPLIFGVLTLVCGLIQDIYGPPLEQYKSPYTSAVHSRANNPNMDDTPMDNPNPPSWSLAQGGIECGQSDTVATVGQLHALEQLRARLSR